MNAIYSSLRRCVRLFRNFWLSLFGFARIETDLIPGKDVDQCHEGFVALGIDPQIIIHSRSKNLFPGWYLISYRAQTGFSDCVFVPAIYPLHMAEPGSTPRFVPTNFGNTPDSIGLIFDQPDARPKPNDGSYSLRAHFSGEIHHLINYRFSAAGFRFDPFDADYPRTRVPLKGWFDIKNLSITRLGFIPLIFFCFRTLFLNHPDTPIQHSWTTGLALFAKKGKSSLLHWLTHQTYRKIQPSLSLTYWWNFYQSKRRCAEKLTSRTTGSALISLVLYCDKNNTLPLSPCIQSIINQDCSDFELVVVNPEAMTREDRFCLRTFRRKSRCVITTSAEIHQKIEGKFFAILDQSVLLEPHAIASFRKAVELHNPDIVYADQAFVSGNSLNVNQISFKPAFSIDYFLASGFIGLPTLVRRNLVGPTNESWMQCSANAVSELLVLSTLQNTKRVLHIPDFLSQRMFTSGEPHTSRLSPQIVQRELRNIGFTQASVEPSKDSTIFQIRFYGKKDGKTAIIIPTKNNLALLRQTVDSINQTVPKDLYDLVIVDHESTDPDCRIYLNALSKEHIVLSYEGVFNFSKINNFAVSHLKTEYDTILFLNNDIEALRTGWLESMRDKVLRPDVGIVGANLLYPHNPAHESRPTIQHSGVILGIGEAEHFMRDERYYDPYAGDKSPNANQPALVTRGFSAVTAACLMTTPQVFKEAGGFDDSLAVAFGDVDLCLKVDNLGYKVLCDGEAVLVHHESATREKGGDIDPHPFDSEKFKHRYRYDVKQGDPFYHPLLVKNNFRYRPIRNPMPPSYPAYRIVDNPGFVNPSLNSKTPDQPN